MSQLHTPDFKMSFEKEPISNLKAAFFLFQFKASLEIDS